MKCPKCGYTRKMGETAPEWQCPSCGIAYAKADAASAREGRAVRGAESAGGGKFIVIGLALLLGIGGYALLKPARNAPSSPQAGQYPRTGVVMYSLTNCGYCNQKRAELQARGIPFVEYFLDTDPARNDEMFKKLRAIGHRGGVGTPTFEVNGRMLPNNPTLATIRKHL